ncbi:SDR family oxidoreductase [Paenibacillus protaetiae]|uniref:SDR family oxidoreductase n=1 Tax=Paenibacillus protaetiae TaxID=2509456 RepID=A0A4P6EXA9_9BACL|nr:SDR family oxidoreductase [Paenibacillus protaetiae]QAY68040.1 SDR family oxidoreductase [Paenibacillus protaetiae]
MPSTPAGQQQPKAAFPPQHQNRQPGIESEMNPLPVFQSDTYKPAGKLANKSAIITGGDSGIGRAVAVAFAKEGANVAIVYYSEHEDANAAKAAVEQAGVKCLLIPGDIGDPAFGGQAVNQAVQAFGGLNIVVNNAAEQHPQAKFEDITPEQLTRTFSTNLFGMFYLTQAAIPHLKPGSTIVNTASITAYKGSPNLIDYSSTKGAIVSFTRSLSEHLIPRGIRVNGVAPGPIWTPLIPSTFEAQQVSIFGSDSPMGRAGQPYELAPAYVYLASDDSSYVSGQIIHVNGGTVVNG